MPAPIDITSRPQARQPKSNLTSQLRAAGDGVPMHMDGSVGARSGSISHGNGVPMNARLRRESMVSNDLARSLMGGGGMSWGGVSVGSWIRDDILMTGTSPFTINSPSFHSSSYLPKLEAEFCRDFSCCGLSLPSLHDLLRHYEDCHAQQSNHAALPHTRQSVSAQSQNPNGISSPIGGMGGIQIEMMRHQQLQRQRLQEDDREHQDDQQEGEIAGDMEMDEDDATPPPNPLTPDGQQRNHLSHPPTPSTIAHPSYNTTPNMQNAQLPNHGQQSGHFSPDSSVPGTPLATDQLDYGFPPNMGAFPYPQGAAYNAGGGYGNMDSVGGDMALDMCIDEPAKRLYSPGGGYAQSRLLMMAGNGEMARGMRDESMMPNSTVQGGLVPEEKPFKCPVVGCEKAYKNQNGLKYHKLHGHVNQQLKANDDGTFSILNPETCAPYPGTMGMEKEKPYRCEGCGKRYKNLNGLKYHRGHTNHETGLPPIGGHGAVVAIAGEDDV